MALSLATLRSQLARATGEADAIRKLSDVLGRPVARALPKARLSVWYEAPGGPLALVCRGKDRELVPMRPATGADKGHPLYVPALGRIALVPREEPPVAAPSGRLRVNPPAGPGKDVPTTAFPLTGDKSLLFPDLVHFVSDQPIPQSILTATVKWWLVHCLKIPSVEAKTTGGTSTFTFDPSYQKLLDEAYGATAGGYGTYAPNGTPGIYSIASNFSVPKKWGKTLAWALASAVKANKLPLSESGQALLANAHDAMQAAKAMPKVSKVPTPTGAPTGYLPPIVLHVHKKASGNGFKVWVTGKTFDIKDTLKDYGFYFWQPGTEKPKPWPQLPESAVWFHMGMLQNAVANLTNALVMQATVSVIQTEDDAPVAAPLPAPTKPEPASAKLPDTQTVQDAVEDAQTGNVMFDGNILYYLDKFGYWRPLTADGELLPGFDDEDIVAHIGAHTAVLLLNFVNDPVDDEERAALYLAAKKKLGQKAASAPAPAPAPIPEYPKPEHAKPHPAYPPPASTPAPPQLSAYYMGYLDDGMQHDKDTPYGFPNVITLWQAVKQSWTSGTALGSTPGVKVSVNGGAFYVKFPLSVEHVASEIAAMVIYLNLDIPAPHVEGAYLPGIVPGRDWAVVSNWEPHVGKVAIQNGKCDWSPAQLTQLAQKHFAMDAWLANHDGIGIGATPCDNTVVWPNGYLGKIEAGGALYFKGTGGPKSFSLEVPELAGLLNPSLNPHAAHAFQRITDSPGLAAEQIAKIMKAATGSVLDGWLMTHIGLARTEKLVPLLKGRATVLANWAATVAKAPIAEAVAVASQPPPAAVPAGVGVPLPPHPYWTSAGGGYKLSQEIANGHAKVVGGGLGGSSAAKQVEAADGTRFYVKKAAGVGAAHAEFFAARMYRAVGVLVPDIRILPPETSSKLGLGLSFAIASPMMPNCQPVGLGPVKGPPASLTAGQRKYLVDTFIMDILLSGWDIVGLSGDNLQVCKPAGFAGSPDAVVRIDVGGCMDYRAQGEKKPNGYPAEVLSGDFVTMLDPKTQMGAFFKPLLSPEGAEQRLKTWLAYLKAAIKAAAAMGGSYGDTVMQRATDLHNFILKLIQNFPAEEAASVQKSTFPHIGDKIEGSNLADLTSGLGKLWAVVSDGTLLFLVNSDNAKGMAFNATGWDDDHQLEHGAIYTVVDVSESIGAASIFDLWNKYKHVLDKKTLTAGTLAVGTTDTGAFMAGAATTLGEYWALVKGSDGLYLFGSSVPYGMHVTPKGFGKKMDPTASYTVVAISEALGHTKASDVLATYGASSEPAAGSSFPFLEIGKGATGSYLMQASKGLGKLWAVVKGDDGKLFIMGNTECMQIVKKGVSAEWSHTPLPAAESFTVLEVGSGPGKMSSDQLWNKYGSAPAKSGPKTVEYSTAKNSPTGTILVPSAMVDHMAYYNTEKGVWWGMKPGASGMLQYDPDPVVLPAQDYYVVGNTTSSSNKVVGKMVMEYLSTSPSDAAVPPGPTTMMPKTVDAFFAVLEQEGFTLGSMMDPVNVALGTVAFTGDKYGKIYIYVHVAKHKWDKFQYSLDVAELTQLDHLEPYQLTGLSCYLSYHAQHKVAAPVYLGVLAVYLETLFKVNAPAPAPVKAPAPGTKVLGMDLNKLASAANAVDGSWTIVMDDQGKHWTGNGKPSVVTNEPPFWYSGGDSEHLKANTVYTIVACAPEIGKVPTKDLYLLYVKPYLATQGVPASPVFEADPGTYDAPSAVPHGKGPKPKKPTKPKSGPVLPSGALLDTLEKIQAAPVGTVVMATSTPFVLAPSPSGPVWVQVQSDGGYDRVGYPPAVFLSEAFSTLGLPVVVLSPPSLTEVWPSAQLKAALAPLLKAPPIPAPPTAVPPDTFAVGQDIAASALLKLPLGSIVQARGKATPIFIREGPTWKGYPSMPLDAFVSALRIVRVGEGEAPIQEGEIMPSTGYLLAQKANQMEPSPFMGYLATAPVWWQDGAVIRTDIDGWGRYYLLPEAGKWAVFMARQDSKSMRLVAASGKSFNSKDVLPNPLPAADADGSPFLFATVAEAKQVAAKHTHTVKAAGEKTVAQVAKPGAAYNVVDIPGKWAGASVATMGGTIQLQASAQKLHNQEVAALLVQKDRVLLVRVAERWGLPTTLREVGEDDAAAATRRLTKLNLAPPKIQPLGVTLEVDKGKGATLHVVILDAPAGWEPSTSLTWAWAAADELHVKGGGLVWMPKLQDAVSDTVDFQGANVPLLQVWKDQWKTWQQMAMGADPALAPLVDQSALKAMEKGQPIPYGKRPDGPPTPLTNPKRSAVRTPSGHVVNVHTHRGPARGPVVGGEDYSQLPATIQRVLGVAATRHEREKAVVLAAAGLPLEKAADHRRNPMGSLTLSVEQANVASGVFDALKDILGPKPWSGGLSSTLSDKIQSHITSLQGSSSASQAAELSGGAAKYLRYLVAARRAGLWSAIIDPGQRVVYHGIGTTPSFGTGPNAQLRPNAESAEQIEAMKKVGLSVGSDLKDNIRRWLQKQVSLEYLVRDARGGKWYEAATQAPEHMIAAHMNMHGHPPVDGEWALAKWGTTYPYPPWAAEPWANVEGFLLDYFGEGYDGRTMLSWSAGYGQWHSSKTNGLRANTRDPRFVLIPTATLKGVGTGPHSGEWEVNFVQTGNIPLQVDMIRLGGEGLSNKQVALWHRARPAYPSGDVPAGNHQDIVLRRNPTQVVPMEGANVYQVHFDGAHFDRGTARAWLRARAFPPTRLERVGERIQGQVHDGGRFRPGSFRKQRVDHGVVAIVGTLR